jgi:SAM-dependent methyltransferase
MTNLEERMTTEIDFFLSLKNKFSFNNALDIGCGTGIHSMILAKCGAEVVSIDPSEEMIKRAVTNFAESKNVRFIHANLENYSENSKHSFESAFCMGNTFAHISVGLEKFVFALKEKLLKEAIFVLQILNYEKIVQEKERIINIRESDEKLFVRFYDFITDSELNFNVLMFDKKLKTHNLDSTPIFAYKENFLKEIFISFGFELIDTFGNMKFEKYNKYESQNLILIFKNNK